MSEKEFYTLEETNNILEKFISEKAEELRNEIKEYNNSSEKEEIELSFV